jgi:hypothetical protein
MIKHYGTPNVSPFCANLADKKWETHKPLKFAIIIDINFSLGYNILNFKML